MEQTKTQKYTLKDLASDTGVKRPTLARKREQISDLRGKGEEPFPCFVMP